MSLSAFEAFENSAVTVEPTARRRRKVYDVPDAVRTLPFVARVVADLANATARAAEVQAQVDLLRAEGNREHLAMQHQLADSYDRTNGERQAALADLAQLEIAVIDAAAGVVGFPTIVNGSLAYLVYSQEHGSIRHWRYRDEDKLRPLPASWLAEAVDMPTEEGLLV